MASDSDKTMMIGRYQVVRRLGAGSFATVYEAHDGALDAPVAIKVLADNLSAAAEPRERFIREARVLRRLDTDRLVRVFDIGELPDGRPYMVMALADRGTLADRLRTLDGPVDAAQLQRLATEIEACLSVVHDAGIIHRDVKPSNLLITSSGTGAGSEAADPLRILGADERLVLGDFGLAKDLLAGTQLTITGGTKGYLAPEQLDPGARLTSAADVFGATAVLFAAHTGAAPPAFEPSTGNIPDLARAFGAVDPRLAPVLEQGLAVDPMQRPQSIGDWLARIRTALDGERPALRVAESSGRKWPRWLAAAVVLIAGLLGGLAVATRSSDDPGPITGPDEIALGGAATYTIDGDISAVAWIAPDGSRIDEPVLRVDAIESGTIRLEAEVVDRSGTHTFTKDVDLVEVPPVIEGPDRLSTGDVGRYRVVTDAESVEWSVPGQPPSAEREIEIRADEAGTVRIDVTAQFSNGATSDATRRIEIDG